MRVAGEARIDFVQVLGVVEDRLVVGLDASDLGELGLHADAGAVGENPAERGVGGAAAEAEVEVLGVAD